MSRPHRLHARRFAAVTATLGLLALGACSQGSSSDNSLDSGDAGGSGSTFEQDAPSAAAPDNALRDAAGVVGASDKSDAAAATTDVPVLQSPDLIRTGRVSIVAKDLDGVRDDIDTLLARYGGTITDETTKNDDDGKPLTSTLEVRVASQWFDNVMTAFKDDPAVKSSDTSSEDVHQQVIDVQARLSNLRTSRGRLQHFLATSTNLQSLLEFERRITSVETDIERLTAQRDYLSDQTSVSTIHIDMRVPKEVAAKPKKHDALAGAGFGSGLHNGWEALKNVAVVVATGIGALLPFAPVALLLGVPTWLVLRRRKVATPAQSS